MDPPAAKLGSSSIQYLRTATVAHLAFARRRGLRASRSASRQCGAAPSRQPTCLNRKPATRANAEEPGLPLKSTSSAISLTTAARPGARLSKTASSAASWRPPRHGDDDHVRGRDVSVRAHHLERAEGMHLARGEAFAARGVRARVRGETRGRRRVEARRGARATGEGGGRSGGGIVAQDVEGASEETVGRAAGRGGEGDAERARDTRDAILVSMKRALEAVKATNDVSAAGYPLFRRGTSPNS